MTLFYNQVEARKPDHLFPGWILTGDVSSLTSVGGGGKGMLSADLMSRVSRGWPMPPYAPDDPTVNWDDVATPGYCIHIPLEDKPDETVWWRLNAAGADLTKIAYLGKVQRAKASGNARSRFSLPEDLPILRSEIDSIGDVRLVVIDPFMSAATTTVSFNQQLRAKLLEPLQEFAEDTGVAIWLVHHLSKGTNGGRLAANSSKSLTDYVAGSKGFTDTLRMNTIITDSPDDHRVKVWQALKSNSGSAGHNLEYMVIANGPDDSDAHIEWRQPQASLNDPQVFERIQARVLEALLAAEGPVTPQRMVALVSQSFAIVNRALANLEASGAVVKRRGAYTAAPSISPVRAAAIEAPKVVPGIPAIGARLDAIINGGA